MAEMPKITFEVRPVAVCDAEHGQAELPVSEPAALQRMDQYFGLWAIDHPTILAMVDGLRSIDLGAHVRAAEGRSVAGVRTRSEGVVAVIDIEGVLTKQGSSFSTAGSSLMLRRAVRAAAADPDVAAIMLRIDSPGGTVAGTMDLAEEVAAANKVKPVYAFVEDLCASAVYWVASQAERVLANNATAKIGSIGTFVVLYDLSKMAERQGVKVHLVKTGQFKGAGTPGTEVTDAQLGMFQEMVTKTQASFSAAVSRGRGLSAGQVQKLVDEGKVWIAADAEELGLIDGVAGFDDALRQLSDAAKARAGGARAAAGETRGAGQSESTDPVGVARGPVPTAEPGAAAPQTEVPMAGNETTKPAAATLAELKAACPKASSDFILKQLEGGATVMDAQKAFIETQQAEIAAKETALAAKEEALAKAAAEAEEARKPKAAAVAPGGKALSDKPAETTRASDEAGATAAERWNLAVSAKVKGGATQAEAVRSVRRDTPDLYEAFLTEHNATHDTVDAARRKLIGRGRGR